MSQGGQGCRKKRRKKKKHKATVVLLTKIFLCIFLTILYFEMDKYKFYSKTELLIYLWLKGHFCHSVLIKICIQKPGLHYWKTLNRTPNQVLEIVPTPTPVSSIYWYWLTPLQIPIKFDCVWFWYDLLSPNKIKNACRLDVLFFLVSFFPRLVCCVHKLVPEHSHYIISATARSCCSEWDYLALCQNESETARSVFARPEDGLWDRRDVWPINPCYCTTVCSFIKF